MSDAISRKALDKGKLMDWIYNGNAAGFTIGEVTSLINMGYFDITESEGEATKQIDDPVYLKNRMKEYELLALSNATKLDEVRAKNEQLRSALQIFADQNNWIKEKRMFDEVRYVWIPYPMEEAPHQFAEKALSPTSETTVQQIKECPECGSENIFHEDGIYCPYRDCGWKKLNDIPGIKDGRDTDGN